VSDAPKGPRRYESPKRQQQARATRRAIVEAGRSLFLSRGYGGTTIEAIAGEAGVAVQTVYAVFGSKPHILSSVLDVAVAGHDSPAALLDREAVRAIGLEPDAGRRVRMFAALMRDVQGRTAAVAQVAREASTTDPEMAQMWHVMQDNRAQEMAEAARSLVGDALPPAQGAARALPPAQGADRALPPAQGAARALPHARPLDEIRDVLWVLCSPEVYQLFVAERLWTPERYEEWLAEAIELLVSPDRRG